MKISIFRCLLQCKIWCNSDKLNIEEFDIFQFGWETHSEGIRPVLSTKAPIPDEMRDMLNISCKDKTCNSKKCQCFRDNLKCTPACKCKECCNVTIQEDMNQELFDF